MNPSGKTLCCNCGAELTGRWCSQCGQKELHDADRRFGHLLAQFAHELIHADGKLPRTVGALLFKPGKPGQAYLQGQRIRYMSPIGLFLVVNLLYFIAPPMTDFNISLEEQYHMQPYSGLIQPLIDQRLSEREQDLSEHGREYDRINLNLARSLIILHIPFLALALTLLFTRRQWYFAEHFVIATQLFTALLIMTLLLGQGGMLVAGFAHWLTETDFSRYFRQVWSLLPLLIGAHWLIAIRRSYDTDWLRAFLSTIALIVALIAGHFCFRAIQFMLVFSLS